MQTGGAKALRWAWPAAESGEVWGRHVDFYWDGPLNSGPRSNVAFLPVLCDLYAEQHPGPVLPPSLCGLYYPHHRDTLRICLHRQPP